MKRVFVCVALLAAFAASSVAFIKATPTMNEFVVVPGEKYAGEFLVENTGTEKRLVKLDVQEWWNASTKMPVIPLDQWLVVRDNKSFVLSPGKRRKIRYKISFPLGTKGEMAAMFFFESTPVVVDPSATNVTMRNGVSLYAVVSSSDDVKGDLKDVQAKFVKDAFTSSIDLSVLVSNIGVVHSRPGGTVTIFKNGIQIDCSDIEWGWPVYPNQQHWYATITKKTEWQPGRYMVVFRVDYGNPFADDIILQTVAEMVIAEDGKIVLNR